MFAPSSAFFLCLSRLLLLLCASKGAAMFALASLSFDLTFPHADPIQRPLALDVTWRYLLSPLMGLFSFKWAQFASTNVFLHILQACGFYWSLFSRECWCRCRSTQQQLVGLLTVVSPTGCSVRGFEWCQAQQSPSSPTPRLRTLVRRLLKIDEKNPAVSPHRFPRHMAGWYSVLLGKDLPGIRSVGLPVFRVCCLSC